MNPDALSPDFALPAWTLDDTERWLTDNPLPADFRWTRTTNETERDSAGRLRIVAKRRDPDQIVLPNYRLHKGYGFWLRTTPYFEGLFEECHDIIVGLGAKLPEDGADLARLIDERRRAGGVQTDLTL
jgi:hypothetical protein